MKNIFIRIIILTAMMLLTACATTPSRQGDYGPSKDYDVSNVPNATPKAEPKSKYGNPRSYVALGRRYYVMDDAKGYDEKGIASWYGMKFYKRRTSSGEPYNILSMTAASKTLPLPTYVQVTNLENHKQVIVKVNDRGPFKQGRIIDLSYAAAKKLGMMGKGTALVEVKAIDTKLYDKYGESYLHSIPQSSERHAPILYLQLGAFTEKANADHMIAKARAVVNEPTRLQPIDFHGKTAYRVQIGPLAGVNQSDALTHRLSEHGLKAIPLVE